MYGYTEGCKTPVLASQLSQVSLACVLPPLILMIEPSELGRFVGIEQGCKGLALI